MRRFMPSEKKAGVGAVFWITFIIFGLIALIGVFYWMIHKSSTIPHSPGQSSALFWVTPVNSNHVIAV